MQTQTNEGSKGKIETQKLVTLAMFSAIAYVIMVIGRVPVVAFLKYDPKDVIITIAGFIYGPLSAFAISLVVSFVEMFTVSDTGFIGLIMNVLSSCSFACTASFIYKKRRTISGAVTGLLIGSAAMVAIMLLWNYLIAPIYMGYPREAVAAMLLPVFLPFNLLKSGLNAAITMLLYKPIVTALRRSGFISAQIDVNRSEKKLSVILLSLLLLATCVFFVLVLSGKI